MLSAIRPVITYCSILANDHTHHNSGKIKEKKAKGDLNHSSTRSVSPCLPTRMSISSVVSVPSLALHDKLIEISTQTSVNHEADIHLDSITEFRLELQGGGKRNEEVNHLDQNTAAC